MKIKALLLVLLLLASVATVKAQVSLNIRIGDSMIKGLAGIELQASNISISTSVRPARLPFNSTMLCYSICGTYYLWQYQTSPYISTGITTHGRYEMSDITGKSVRSFLVIGGIRVYPSNFSERCSERLSIDIGAGANFSEYKTIPSIELMFNWALFK
jgi:hypothetical protein